VSGTEVSDTLQKGGSSMSLKAIILFIFFCFMLFGCSLIEPESDVSQTQIPISLNTPPINGKLSNHDTIIFKKLKEDIATAIIVTKELDTLISEFQQSDELDSAIEAMKIAQEETMFIRNSIHLLEPDHASLIQIQQRVEDLLINYVNALQIQMHGIENGDVEEINEGYQKVEEAKQFLQGLLK
jgi:hypothetical protein